jgi:diguanylate cyclase (GGDEF)-like protein
VPRRPGPGRPVTRCWDRKQALHNPQVRALSADLSKVRTDVTAGARRRRRAGTALVLVVLVIGLTASWSAAVAVEGNQQRHAAQLMDRYAEDISQAVVDEAGRYTDALSNLAAAVGAQSDLTAGDFAEITSRLGRQHLPGASSAIFAVPATAEQVPAVQAYWRGQGTDGLRFAPVGAGPEHMFVVFNRPLDNTVPVLGRDVSQAAEPAEALRMSRASGQVAASRTYVLLKDRQLPAAQQQMSFVLAAPVLGGMGAADAGRFRGWVFMGMRGGDFIAETLLARSQGAVSATLDDMSDGPPRAVVTSSGPTPQPSSLDRQRVISVGQRNWHLRMYATDTLLSGTDRRMPALTLGIAVVITLLLTTLVAILTSTRNRAMTKVDRATTALRHDIERRKQIEAQLRERDGDLQYLALHDPLTGLANRTLFYERVEHALLTHHRSGSPLAVFFIDLDGFKQVNDERGHSAGDAVLVEVAARLHTCLRASDTIARLGGDEFAILAEHVTAPDHADVIAERIVRTVQAPFDTNGEPTTITASVGVAICQPDHFLAEDMPSGDDMLRSADEAMYVAKTSGKDRYVLVGAPR